MNVMPSLRWARHRAGLTQRELAERTGVAQPTIARIESGRVVPRVDTLQRLLRACGLQLEAVPLEGEGIDRTLIRRHLEASVAQRAEAAQSGARTRAALRRATPA